ncbi:MAG: N-acetylmuramoyl-L-alanine amidase [Clostridia bacterium]|nr:N-acetylmuramoyl-L-alanine amidase [Clostridia bacterium]
MHPEITSEKRKKLSKVLLIIAGVLAGLILIIIIYGSIADNPDSALNATSGPSTPTPYGTEFITPFYTPTPVPTVDPGEIFTPVPSPVPTPSTVPINMTEMYKKGDSGDDIVLIQKMLIAIGFDPGEADGDFGSSLKDTVKQFQLYSGLDNDGIAGPTTISNLVQSWLAMSPLPLEDNLPLYGIKIGIDAGHQRNANTGTEPVSPGSSETKAKTSSGTQGVYTELYEYELNLMLALKLKIRLEALGAEVIMTREINNIDISNAQRAEMMNDAKVACWIRIHANGSESEDSFGMSMLLPTASSLSTKDTRVYEKSKILANQLLESTIASTGAKNLGTQERSDLTGFNWSEVPVCLIETGYMTNSDEDKLLITKAYQKKIVDGLVDGLLKYFNVG